MTKRKINIVAIIVNYKSKDLALKGIESIYREKLHSECLKISVVVVENKSGEYEDLCLAIKDNDWSEWVTVIDSPYNGGFGYGNNLGFKHGFETESVDYFYLLNPDAQCYKNAISELINALELDHNAAIAGSGFFNEDGSLWPIAFRFPSLFSEIDKGFRIGFISKLLKPWSVAVEMTQVKQTTDWVAGASMMLRASVIKTLNGFDESYFLYYEETDLCKRAKQIGFHTLYVPASKVLHIAGQSTKVTERNNIRKRVPDYWYQSRSMYYLKNHGFIYALLADFTSLTTHLVGNTKLVLFKKPITTPLFFITDTMKNTVLNKQVNSRIRFTSLLMK
jgi:hypothetical protein